jgi:hypothetical protein
MISVNLGNLVEQIVTIDVGTGINLFSFFCFILCQYLFGLFIYRHNFCAIILFCRGA